MPVSRRHSRKLGRALVVLSLWLGACGGDDTVRVTPATGDIRGGVPVRIEGDGFLDHGTVGVYFGRRTAKGVVVEGPRLIRVITPIGLEQGPVPVTVRFGDGTILTAEPEFEYTAPAGIKIRPSPVGPIVDSG